jgi:hypothetical protein
MRLDNIGHMRGSICVEFLHAKPARRLLEPGPALVSDSAALAAIQTAGNPCASALAMKAAIGASSPNVAEVPKAASRLRTTLCLPILRHPFIAVRAIRQSSK